MIRSPAFCLASIPIVALGILTSLQTSLNNGGVVGAFSPSSSTTSAIKQMRPTSTTKNNKQSLILNRDDCHCANANVHNMELRMNMSSSASTTTTTTSTTTTKTTSETEGEGASRSFLEPDSNGIYSLNDKEDHIAWLEQNKDKLCVVKFYAPWCRACKGLEPKYIQVAKDPKYNKLPLTFAQLSVATNKEYVKSLGILALPSIHIYGSGEEGLVENFPCGPSKVPVLKKKIAQVVNERVDPKTMTLKPFVPKDPAEQKEEDEAKSERAVVSGATTDKTTKKVGEIVVSEEKLKYIRMEIPFFKDFSDEEFDTLMSKSVYKTFDAGSVIMKQGQVGTTFYVIDDGEVEISVKGAYEDPLSTPSNYLGTVVNRLSKNNYFGERSLITGQPRAASIRAIEKTHCFSFDIKDIPASSVLSGKALATEERMKQIDDKYALDYYDIDLINKQFVDVAKANQVKGSPNGPSRDKEQEKSMKASNDAILSLLVRFKLLRQAARCFEYILQTQPTWGDKGEVYRRSLLVTKLTAAQREEFREVFKMIDTSHDGRISINELKQALESIYDEQQDDDKVKEMINKANPRVDGNTEMSMDEFMGVMAEAEFYYLFKETFATLDKENSGYVQAYKLDKVLCGLRDLISDDRKSIIDVDDKDMLIDYETFSRMMIGTW